MLLDFRTKNFKSFQDELVFSMTPAPKQRVWITVCSKKKLELRNTKA